MKLPQHYKTPVLAKLAGLTYLYFPRYNEIDATLLVQVKLAKSHTVFGCDPNPL